MKVLKLNPVMTDLEADRMAGLMLKEENCTTLVDRDCDVYCKESGALIAKFRKNVIPSVIQGQAYRGLLKAAVTTNNRGTGGGRTEEGQKVSNPRKLKNGMLSKTTIAEVPVDSGIVGFFDRNSRFPYCRQTAFNQHHFEKFKSAYPIIKFVDKKYAELVPEAYARQREVADRTSQDFVIKGTSFTTVTVNKNWQTAVHKDQGDFKEGFGNLVALRRGKYTGGHFVVVKWGVGFDLQNGDLLLVDVHQWHGNTPIITHDPKVVRLSLVMYYREKMINCGTMDQELRRVKLRKHGEKLN